jgi:hypothetical protein
MAVKQVKPKWLFAPIAVAAAVAIVTIVNLPIKNDDAGIKSAPADLLTLPMPVLRFALVGADQQVTSGVNNMEVPVGSSLIFSVETENLPKPGAVIDILYQSPSGRQETLVNAYRIVRGTNVIEGKKGFIAFTPEEVGTYTFSIAKEASVKNGKAIQFAGEAHAGRFTINVTK